MTVTEIAPSGRHYICKWFAGAKLEDGHFPEEALQEAKEENKKK